MEATREMMAGMLADRPAGLEAEVFAYGRMPLAFSARCFTARRFNRQKEDCGYACLDFPDGMALATREGKPFLAVNGIQTQSAGVYCLVEDLQLREAGADSCASALSPRHRQALRVLRAACEAAQRFEARWFARSGQALEGFWHARPGMEAA
jgi:collagenase-like PrtC family protease